MDRLHAFLILAVLLLSVFVFPPGSGGSGAFYASLFFFASALAVSSFRVGVKKGLSGLGLSIPKKGAGELLVQSLLLFIACGITTVAASGVFFLLGRLDTQYVYEKVVQLPPSVLIAAFTLAPLGEEAFFRGLLFRKGERLMAGLGKHAWLFAALASSLIFALLHSSYGSVAEVGVAFAIGMVLCAGVKATGSLWPAVLAHAAFNFVSISMAVFA